MLVSWRWCHLISSPQLILDWKPPKSASSFFFRRYSALESDRIKFNFVSLNEPLPNRRRPMISLDFVSDPSGIKISQSCGGLLLCSSSSSMMDSDDTRYYVYNPTTKRYTAIPRPRSSREQYNVILSMNLAFDPSVSLHYKVLCVCSNGSPSSPHKTDVYSSDTGKWVLSTASFDDSCGALFENGIFLNGKIHWPSCSETSIYYDLNRAKVLQMPMPMPVSWSGGLRRFEESGGRLLFVSFSEPRNTQFDVFEMQRDYSTWFLKYRVDLQVGAAAFPGLLSSPYRDCDFDSIVLRPWMTIHRCMETLSYGDVG
ncbi:F-box protein At5g07610-like isoform X1 [Diospyros lotus]|uniref:F-box protein At5g07610-like isoform X1 n=1 Tax=Diospyros lotus TaxID=55363 RepID=UPI00224D697C|nr:F-box protein At5g07610-like isoform X1 [Diospyros lotus]